MMPAKETPEVNAPESLKSEEKVLSDGMVYMIDLISSMYRNQVLKELNKGTIDKFADKTISFGDSIPSVLVSRLVKFADGMKTEIRYEYDRDETGSEYCSDSWKEEVVKYSYRDELVRIYPQHIVDGDRLQINDAQTGNYSSVLLMLSNRVTRKLLARFDNDRIEKLTRQVMTKNDARSKKLFYDRVARQMGVDPSKLLKKDGMTYDFNALVLETTQWAKKLRDETLELYTANTLRAMTFGDSIESILKQYDRLVEKRKNHAEFTARNQIVSFNSIMNKTRANKLGIKKAIWIASNDERTRPSHEWRNNKEFDLNEGLYSSIDGLYLLPGTDYSCRCNYRFVLEDEE